MDEKNWYEYSRIEARLEQNYYQQASVRDTLSHLDDKIVRLSKAHQNIEEDYSKALTLKDNVKQLPTNYDTWVGENANECFYSCKTGNLYSAYSDYLKRIDKVLRQINKKITELKQEKRETQDFLTRLCNEARNIQSEYENYWDE